jgi:hypothetical protein
MGSTVGKDADHGNDPQPGNMSKCGLLVPMSDASKKVSETLTNDDILKKGRVHPIGILIAMKAYESGRPSEVASRFRKGPIETWTAVPKVVDALDEAFYKAFYLVEPTGKRFYLGLDISGSMWSGVVAGVVGLTPAVASGAMAITVVKTEDEYYAAGYLHSGTGDKGCLLVKWIIRVGWHAFLTGLASNLNRTGIDDSVIQAILRYSDVNLTQACYIKTTRPESVAAMKQFSVELAQVEKKASSSPFGSPDGENGTGGTIQ